jgi:hypothetical protein
MSSELVPDILNGLVATGTLALAGATVFVGRAAVRGSVDARCPRVVVTSFWVEDEPRTVAIAANVEAGEIKPGLPWSMAQHGADLIGLRAVGQLRNERAVTALFRFECGTDCSPGPVTCRDPDRLGGLMVPAPSPPRDGWHVIAPGGWADFSMLWLQPASAWAEAWPRGGTSPESSPPVTRAQIVVRGASGDAQDRCDLTFGGYVVVPHPREDGWVIAAVDKHWRSIPGTAPERVATIGLMRRSYPGLIRRRAD